MNDIEDTRRYTAPPEPSPAGRDEMDIAHEWAEEQLIEQENNEEPAP
jgi:hypothetical protein